MIFSMSYFNIIYSAIKLTILYMIKLTKIIIALGLSTALILTFASCKKSKEDETPKTFEPSHIPTATIPEEKTETESTSKPADSEDSSPKLTGDLSNIPTIDDIKDISDIEVTSVLASDSLEYELPLNENFAVALREDVTKGVRWLLASEDGKYKLLDEQHINGYRVFIFSSDIKGETHMLFELESGGVVADTLSYQLFLGTPGGDR
jgi:hypothetical protein